MISFIDMLVYFMYIYMASQFHYVCPFKQIWNIINKLENTTILEADIFIISCKTSENR